MASFDELVERRNKLNAEIKAMAKEELQTVVYDLFAENPDLKNFGWWNASYDRYCDGTDPGIGALNVNIDLEDASGDGYIYLFCDTSKLRDAVLTKMRKFDDDLLRTVLSNGEIIVITPEEVLTFENYE